MKFAEVLEIKNGKNQKQVEDADGKYPIYGSGGIMGWATDYICPAETVIIGRKGTINNPIYVDTPFWNVDTAFGLVADKNILLPKYLYYFCKHFDFLALNTTVTIPSLTKANLLKINIPIPNMDEQRYISGLLDNVEKLIEIKTNEKVELDNLVKSRFIEMFGNKEFPIYKWKDVFKTTTGKLDSNAMVPDGPYPFFTCAKEIFRIDKYAFDQEALLLAGNNAAGKYDVKHYKGKFNAYQRTYVLTLKNSWSYSLFKYQLEDKLTYLQEQSKGSNTRYITLKILGDLEFIVPPIELQNQFASFVEQTDKLKFDGIKIIKLCEILKIKSWRRES